MQGEHPPLDRPLEGASYAFLIDVGGEDAAGEQLLAGDSLQNPSRDLTALTILSEGLSGLKDPLQRKPSYRVVHRR